METVAGIPFIEKSALNVNFWSKYPKQYPVNVLIQKQQKKQGVALSCFWYCNYLYIYL